MSFPTSIDFNEAGDAFVTTNGVGAPGSGQVVKFAGLAGEGMAEGEAMAEGEEMAEGAEGEMAEGEEAAEGAEGDMAEGEMAEGEEAAEGAEGEMAEGAEGEMAEGEEGEAAKRWPRRSICPPPVQACLCLDRWRLRWRRMGLAAAGLLFARRRMD